ncbi:FecR family protein [Desertivirga xinjiangensis]|uniref:FecR family protein n=1 Tax=Desertivirga xinjiangensis TaxID=539206 RepID=UPI00210EACD4|nr:FecR family protein [Pedobacter xinjiangensis]
MEKPDFDALLEKYLKGECSTEERDLVESWYMRFNDSSASLSQSELEKEVGKMTESLAPLVPISIQRVSVLRRLRLPLSIAASILVIFSISYLLLSERQKEELVGRPQEGPISPGRQAASLTLASGKKIFLSEQQTGEVAQEAGVSIIKTSNGELAYEIKGTKGVLSGFNTLSTTNGESYRVKLPDGSIVWLNAASSLKYPVSFEKYASRVVSLTGEAYFEIAKDSRRPFIVNSRGQQVEVLGTHFNINAYDDEPVIRTTLLEGSVRLKATGSSASRVLKPGQQAELMASNVKILPADTRTVTAWKDGYFRFSNENLQSVMRKISRWYNVDVVFEKGLPEDTYSGAVTRHSNIRQVLEIMEGSNNIHFTIKERRIIVSK